MGFIVAFWAIVIYVVLCAVFAQNLPITIIVSIVWIGICAKLAFADDKLKKEELSFRIIAFIVCCSLTALPIGLAIKNQVKENEHKANKCLVSSCDRERENERNSYYCYRHTCRYDDCTNQKDWRESYCYYHQTEKQSNIIFENQSVEKDNSGYWVVYIYRATVKNIPSTQNIVYATLTFYKGDKIVYQDYEFLYCTFKNNHQSSKNASIHISSENLPKFDRYEWNAYMSKPKQIGVN